jgi:NAD-dependent deacetylase
MEVAVRTRLEALLRESLDRRGLVISGAGLSAGSGIPTFRGEGGYWRNLKAEDLATRAAFDRSPELVWEWYRERRRLIREASPNAAHVKLAELLRHAPGWLHITQNVDDLNERAGAPPEQLVHVHGEIFENGCERCDHTDREDRSGEQVPRCPRCGARLRPGVVWFDEELPTQAVARIERFLAGGEVALVLVIGTTGVFSYLRAWSRRAAGVKGMLIEINPEPGAHSTVAHWCVREKAEDVLVALRIDGQ